jgi:hypothetical protein
MNFFTLIREVTRYRNTTLKTVALIASSLLFFAGVGPRPFLDMNEIVLEVQDTLNWSAYYANYFGRKIGRDLEWTTRPNKDVEYLFAKKMARYASLTLSAPIAFTLLPAHMLLNIVASYIPAPRFRTIHGIPTGSTSNTITLASLNGCLHEGLFAPTTGGVVPPFDSVGSKETRVGAIAEIIGAESPEILVGQEFHDLRSIKIFIKELQRFGYTSFAYDPSPHLIGLSSGLFVASKRKLSDINFVPFVLADRGGKAKAIRSGTLTFTVLDAENKPLVKIINAHLNSGGPEWQFARNNQLKSYVLPEFVNTEVPSILLGDLNFDTSEYKDESGLNDYTNILEGTVTCTSEGKRDLRGRKGALELEKVDGILGNSDRIEFSNLQAKPLKENEELLSDHYLLSVTAEIR